MSYHLIHILNHGSRLSVRRGCLVCTLADQIERKAPLEDILAVIVAARGVSFSNDSLSALTANGAIILHCDDSYRPLAQTAKLSSVIHKDIFERQLFCNGDFIEILWNSLLFAKISNQAELLDFIAPKHTLRNNFVEGQPYDEGNLQRLYWKTYFRSFGKIGPHIREHQGTNNPVNQKLNYGYAVLGAILHRSIVGHGLNPCLGIHHRYRFKSNPLVYDLIEPLRPFCDALLHKFYRENNTGEMKDWAKTIVQGLIEGKIDVFAKKKLKLLYAVDFYVSGIADYFLTGKINRVFIPKLTKEFIEKS